MKKWSKVLAIVLSAAMLAAGCGVSQDETPAQLEQTEVSVQETESRETEGQETAALETGAGQAENVTVTWDPNDDFMEWDEPRDDGRTPLDSMLGMASDDLDVTRFKYSEMGVFALDTMNRGFTGNEDPASIEYWERLGLVKTVHDAEDEDHIWALYVPESYYEEENSDREYPLVFIWHGYYNQILVAEQYGFLEEAADREYIAVIPWAANDDDYLEETERLYGLLTEEYRIDTSRVYSTGFSLGGQTSLALALEKSELFAAVAGCGTSAGGVFYDADYNAVEIPAGHGPLTEDDFAQAAEIVPAMVIAGDCDMYRLMPVNTEDKVWAVNAWLEHEGVGSEQTLENSLDLLENSEDEVEKKIGVEFDETQIRSMDGFYYIGRFYNEDGENMFAMVNLENGIHSTSRGMARLVFEFFDQHTK